MSTVIAFFAGVCLMSLSAIAAVNCSDTSHDGWTCFFMGPVVWVYLAIGIPIVRTYKAVTLHDFKKNYVRARVMQRNDKDNKDFMAAVWYIHKDVVDLFYHEGENHDHAYIVIEADCTDAKSYPYKFERTINKKGFRYKGDAKDHFTRKLALDRIRPYTDLYQKVEHGG